VRKVTVDGIITTIAGLGGSPGFAGDGGLATAARLSSPHGVAVGRDGSVFLTDYDNQRIRRVGPDGVIRTLTGTGFPGYLGDGGPAMQARIFNAQQIAVAPDGSVYFADGNNQRVRQIRPPLLGIAVGATVVASPDARELYAFNDTGRHLQTLDALTGAVLFQFSYNASGALTGITDVDGNTTSIERSAGGSPTAIVAPFGQRTELAVDAAGYLASVSAPGGATVALTYATGDAEGLLTSLTDARGGLHQYAYDTLGRLASDANPAGGTKALTRTELGDGHYRVTVTRGSGLVSSHEVEELPSGTTRRLRTAPGGAVTETLLNPDGSTQITYPDGVVLTTVEGPDPRFGMQSPVYTAVTVAVPGGLTSTRTTTRSATLSDPANLLSLATLTESIVQNGQTWTTSYNAGTRTITATSPAGRSAKTVLDAKGHVVTVLNRGQSGVRSLPAVRSTVETRGSAVALTL